ncbi:uncharacterized protein LOC122046064 [Zingiber officinale]|uniref:uncharacterized protein LOC122046064 n=1 Tax=Zingiber officinale TaxID=94328 RepID=UPI001C4D7D79|nr:uncharacterized protein LOC122046064 [Zingiber officinale]
MKSLSIAGSGCKINLVDANLSLSQPLLLATLPNPTKSFETVNFLSFYFLFVGYRVTPVEARVRAKERTKPVSTRNDDTCSQGLSASVGLSRSIGFSLGASLPAGPIRKFHASWLYLGFLCLAPNLGTWRPVLFSSLVFGLRFLLTEEMGKKREKVLMLPRSDPKRRQLEGGIAGRNCIPRHLSNERSHDF